MKRVTVFITTLLLFCFSCKPKDEYFYVDPNLLGQYTYPSGSYWIYKDLETGGFDSLSWSSQVRGNYPTSAAGLHELAETYTTYINAYDKATGTQTSFWTISLTGARDWNRVSFHITLVPTTLAVQFLYNPVFSTPGVAEIEFIPSMVINGQTFDNVYHSTFQEGGQGQPTEHVYINGKVGVLKLEQDRNGVHRTIEIDRWYIPR